MRSYFERGNWLVEFIEQWSQFFTNCNWYTFNPLHVEFEDDRAMGGVEITVILLGVGIRWRWNHTETEARAGIVRQVTEIKSRLAMNAEDQG